MSVTVQRHIFKLRTRADQIPSIVYQNIRPEEYSLEYASTILACFAILVCSPVFYFYRNGPAIREKCKFAKQVLEERKRQKDHRAGSGARHSEESSASAGEP